MCTCVGPKDSVSHLAPSPEAERETAPRVLLGVNSHGGVLEHGDAPGEIGDHLGRGFALLCDGGGELARVLLDVADVRLELDAELLEVLDDGSLDRLGEVGMVVRDQARLLALLSLRVGQSLGQTDGSRGEDEPRTTL